MGMIVYQLYLGSVNNTASLTTTGKGKVVAISWSSAIVGGAAVGINGLSVVKNTAASISASWAISNPQKQLVVMNVVLESGVTAVNNEHDLITGIALDYIPGDTFSLLALNNGGTVPTSMISMVQLYCVE